MRLRRIGIAAGCAAIALFSFQATAHAAPTYNLNIVGAFGGEPSITSDSNGLLYVTTPSGSAPVYRSTDAGQTWTSINHTGWSSSGDDCIVTDQSNAAYWCNLGDTSHSTAPLQADAWKSTIASTCTAVCSWVHGTGAVGNSCGTSCSPVGVDRQWLAASIPTGGTTANAVVVLTYHDFYGPSSIWVNISTNGGATFGAPVNAIAGPAFTVNSLTGTVTAEGYTFCSTVPAGVGIVPPGKPHAGRIIVGWIAADPPSDASGCNLTMAAAFHTVWVSYSDDGGSTWTPQQAFDGGIGHDTSTPFVGMNFDTQGNPYFGFGMLHWDPNAAINQANVGICASEAQMTSLQSDIRCNYDMYVVWSADAGATWHHGSDTGGVIPGSAGIPFQASPPTQLGTRFFPTIAAGDPGKVDVGWLWTPTIEPSDALGKVLPGGCAGPNTTNRTNFPPKCRWDLWEGQSLNLTGAPSTATWTSSDLTPSAPMHTGDVCTLGIACVGTLGASRALLDFNQETVDPTTGCAHIVFADNNGGGDTTTVPPSPASPYGNFIDTADQQSGPAIIGTGNCSALAASIPEVPWSILLPGVSVAAAMGVASRVRARRRRAAAGR